MEEKRQHFGSRIGFNCNIELFRYRIVIGK